MTTTPTDLAAMLQTYGNAFVAQHNHPSDNGLTVLGDAALAIYGRFADLSEDFHSASRCGNAGPECPGCVIEKVTADRNEVRELAAKREAELIYLRAELTRTTEQRDTWRQMWNERQADFEALTRDYAAVTPAS